LLGILLLRNLLLGVLLLRHSLVRVGFLLAGLHAWLFAILRLLWTGVLRRSHRGEYIPELLDCWGNGFSFQNSLDLKIQILLFRMSGELFLDLGLT
jgi:hypothetical protein